MFFYYILYTKQNKEKETRSSLQMHFKEFFTTLYRLTGIQGFRVYKNGERDFKQTALRCAQSLVHGSSVGGHLGVAAGDCPHGCAVLAGDLQGPPQAKLD